VSAKAEHTCRVLASPWPGVYATVIESARHYGKHWHATYGLGLMDDGAHRSSSGRGAVDAYAGDIVTTNPGEVHDGRPLGAPTRKWRTVYLEPEIVASVAAEAGVHGDVAFTDAAFRDPIVRDALVRLLDAMENADAAGQEEALVEACGLMIERHSTGGTIEQADVPMAKVIDRMQAEALPQPTLGELAGLAGIGRFQLLRRFRTVFGITPHAWLLQHRAELARRRIAAGAAIAQAAAETGFADQSHLTRVFVQRFGFTPGAWRAAQFRSRRAA